MAIRDPFDVSMKIIISTSQRVDESTSKIKSSPVQNIISQHIFPKLKRYPERKKKGDVM